MKQDPARLGDPAATGRDDWVERLLPLSHAAWQGFSRAERLLLAAALLGAVFRLIYPIAVNPLDFLYSDPLRHWLNGEHPGRPGLMGALDPLGYQAYVAVLRTVLGDSRVAIGLATGLLSAATPFPFYFAARELGIARPRALAALVLITLCPSLLAIFHYFMMETLMLPLLGLALWASAAHLRHGGSRRFAWSALVWTATVMTKSTVAPVAALFLAYGWLRASRQGRDLAAALAIAAVVMMPNAIRTGHNLGFAAPLGSGYIPTIMHRSGLHGAQVYWGDEYWIFKSPSTVAEPFAPFSSWQIARAQGRDYAQIHASPATGRAGWEQSLEQYRFGWREYLPLVAENGILLLFAPSWPDDNSGQWLDRMQVWGRFVWMPLIVLVIAGNFRDWWQGRWHVLALATTGFFVFLLVQPYATIEGRYRKPLEPLLFMNLMLVWPGRGRREMTGDRALLIDRPEREAA